MTKNSHYLIVVMLFSVNLVFAEKPLPHRNTREMQKAESFLQMTTHVNGNQESSMVYYHVNGEFQATQLFEVTASFTDNQVQVVSQILRSDEQVFALTIFPDGRRVVQAWIDNRSGGDQLTKEVKQRLNQVKLQLEVQPEEEKE